MKKPKKYKRLVFKLYENQFEVWEADGRKIMKTDGCFESKKKSEVLVALMIFVDKFMNVRKDRPLIITIEEGVFMPIKDGGIKTH